MVEQLAEVLAFIERAGGPVGEDALTVGRLEGVSLEPGVLLQRRDPGVIPSRSPTAAVRLDVVTQLRLSETGHNDNSWRKALRTILYVIFPE